MLKDWKRGFSYVIKSVIILTMTKKSLEENHKGVVDLRSRVAFKNDNLPLKISNNQEPVPKIKSGIGKTFLIILFILAGISLVAGWIFLSNPSKESETSLKLVVDAPKAVVAGETFNIRINYENIDIASLKNVRLTVEHPELWYLDNAEVMPVDENQTLWKLDDLVVGEKKEINLQGVLFGEKKQDNLFTIRFNYQPENFSSQFEDKVEFKINLSEGYFSQTNDWPSEINIEDNKVVELEYLYQADKDNESYQFELLLPDGVKIASSTPMAVNNSWLFDSWNEGEKKKINLILTSDRTTVDQVKMLAKKDERIVGSWSSEVKINAPSLFISVENVGSEIINYDQNLNLQIKLTNNGTSDYLVDTVRAIVTSDLIDWDNVKIKDVEINERQIIWHANKGEAGKSIKVIKPGEQKILSFVIPTLKKGGNDLLTNKSLIKISSLAVVNNNSEQKSINGSGLELVVVNPLTVSTVGRYYASVDNPVGSGPIPPRVGDKTTYQIIWTIATSNDELKDVSLTTTLPGYVSWEGQDEEVSGGGKVSYSSTDKKVSWQISKLNPNQQMTVAFMVSVSPSESQVNQIMVLTNGANFTARNQSTGIIINNNYSVITSELPNDEFVTGGGRVRAQ